MVDDSEQASRRSVCAAATGTDDMRQRCVSRTFQILRDNFNIMDCSQYSDINSPTLLPQVNNTAVPTKKADLAIAISAHTPATAPLYTALRTSDPTMRLSHMSDPSVSRLALPGCVEVGEPGKNYLEASLQLGVWCFAGLAKLDELKMQAGTTLGCAGAEESLPLFGWTAVGMDWRLHIAYRDKNDGGVIILGPLDSGGLGSVMAFFKLFATATWLAMWVKDKYWGGFKKIVQK